MISPRSLPASTPLRRGTRELFCAGHRPAAEMAGGCRSDPDHLPRLHKGMLIPSAGGEGGRPSTPSVPLCLSGKAHRAVTVTAAGTGHARPGNPMPVGAAPGPHVAGIFPQPFLQMPPGFSRKAGQRRGEVGGTARLGLLPAKGCAPESRRG